MIYTVTFNPAVDYVVHLNAFAPGETNRSVSEEVYFGGKGINVSIILAQLGMESTALGFVAGFTGEALEKALVAGGTRTDFIRLPEGMTRINVKMKGDCETEINASGPRIDAASLEKLFAKLEVLQAGDTLVLAGSVPGSLPADIYEQILKKLSGRGIRFVVDATGKLLLNVLKYRPFLIKPNRAELEEICGRKLDTQEKLVEGASELKAMGAQNVLISLGKDGALLLDEHGKVHTHEVLGGKPVNTVGAGDSMVAGFIAGCEKGYEHALLMGVAAGGATACAKGLATREEIFALLPQ